MFKFDGSSSYTIIPKEVIGNKKIFTVELSLKTTEKKNDESYWCKPTIFGAAISRGFGECNMTISEGYLSCWEGITSGGDVDAVSSYYVADNKLFHCAIICNGSTVKFFYKDKVFAQWDIYRETGNVDFYLGFAGPQNPGPNAYCQMDLYRCKIYSIAKDINDLYTDSNRDDLLALYGNKASGTTLLNEVNPNYNATMYNCEFKQLSNMVFSNLKID